MLTMTILILLLDFLAILLNLIIEIQSKFLIHIIRQAAQFTTLSIILWTMRMKIRLPQFYDCELFSNPELFGLEFNQINPDWQIPNQRPMHQHLPKIQKVKLYKNRLIDRSLDIDSDISKVFDRLDKRSINGSDSIYNHQYVVIDPVDSEESQSKIIN